MAVVRLSKVAIEFNVGISTIVEFLHKKGFDIDVNPNSKVSEEMLEHLQREYKSDQNVKKALDELSERKIKEKKETILIDKKPKNNSFDSKEIKVDVKPPVEDFFKDSRKNVEFKVVGKIELPDTKKVEKKFEAKQEKKVEHPPEKVDEIKEEKIVENIDLEEVKVKKNKKKKKKKKNRTEQQISDTEIVQAPEHQKIPEIEQKVSIKEQIIHPKLERKPENFVPTKVKKLLGPTVVGKIDLPPDAARIAEIIQEKKAKKKQRKRIKKERERINIAQAQAEGKIAQPPKEFQKEFQKEKQIAGGQPKPFSGTLHDKKKLPKIKKRTPRPEVSDDDVAKQIKDTLARLTSKGKSKAARHRRDKRELMSQRQMEEMSRIDQEKKLLRVTEFVTANDLSNMMNVPVNQVIAAYMSLGLFVSINQRLNAETIALVAEEFGFKVEFTSISVAESIKEVEDKPEDLHERPPIVTVMGHVDHGKTSLLDYIRNTDVITGEAGGITQHIGAYSVKLENERKITFLDTPGHEAFTAMRARGASVTDIVIILIAADDNVMPQTVEAINHASAAGVPIVFAINKIDKANANPEKVKEELSKMNYLVEDWGGKYQCQEISAKKGTNVKYLLEKVLLEADMLELKANANKPAVGTVIESSLDKGRGFVATLLVQSGSLKVGDMILSGSYYGNVKAMFNERNQKITSVGPSEPVAVLGLNGAPQAGEKFNVMENEKETKEIASKRMQLQREQGLRAQKHITLEEIGRRIAIGNFQELNLVVKGDVDGSVEALSDSLIKLSTEEIQVNVIHKAVGGISESDIMLAAASNAIVIGFQVRPALSARKLAEKEQIDIRLYSIIYDAIEEIKAAMEGMLSPEIKEQIHATVEVLEVFKITKVGTIGGCIVKEGKIRRNSKVRLIRDGIVIYTGELGSLKRFKDEAKEVVSGLECGLNIQNFNDIKVGDFIEAYEEIEVLRKL